MRTSPLPPTVGELSEGELLDRILPRLAGGAEALLGPGDDAAVLAAPDRRVVVSTDTQTQDADFRLVWPNGYRHTGFDVGWKAAAQNLSDINAMGAVATGIVVSLTLPPATPVGWVEDLADGLAAGVRGLGATRCALAGGDLGRGGELSITATVLGSLDGRAPVLRSGARPGDILAVVGALGPAAAGLELLERGPAYDELDAALRELVARQCRPIPPLEAGPAAALAGATALMDLSDGLERDSLRLAQASGVRLDFHPDALRVYAEPLRSAAALLGADALAWVLGGGEDHGLLAAFPADAQLPHGFAAIGSVLPADGGTPGVSVGGHPAASRGWDHFAW
ncbi:thiamine-phosphate kinase [Sinomonas sp. ASV322]|uniref:thiamine-phosphate kinase n=1 Tax=Sinomonas sp. ASV322 TaxID=3041920 RepID=UPI0027DCD8D4|nr:thiamine-phosphate kinase [Sinomonas sp. ASV322]MDQ4502238.1 thiamine-phosphate kinase [Sinomonas sp. ASV322]